MRLRRRRAGLRRGRHLRARHRLRRHRSRRRSRRHLRTAVPACSSRCRQRRRLRRHVRRRLLRHVSRRSVRRRLWHRVRLRRRHHLRHRRARRLRGWRHLRLRLRAAAAAAAAIEPAWDGAVAIAVAVAAAATSCLRARARHATSRRQYQCSGAARAWPGRARVRQRLCAAADVAAVRPTTGCSGSPRVRCRGQALIVRSLVRPACERGDTETRKHAAAQGSGSRQPVSAGRTRCERGAGLTGGGRQPHLVPGPSQPGGQLGGAASGRQTRPHALRQALEE